MTVKIKIAVPVDGEHRVLADSSYVPVQAGKEGGCFNAFRWACDNLDADYLGLAAYGRAFASRRRPFSRPRISTSAQLAEALQVSGVVLPAANAGLTHSYASRAEIAETLCVLRDIFAGHDTLAIRKLAESTARVRGHRSNMFVMKHVLACEWCSWLSAVLKELNTRMGEDRVLIDTVTALLLDVWVESNGLAYWEMPTVHVAGHAAIPEAKSANG